MHQEVNRAETLWYNWQALERKLHSIQGLGNENPTDLNRQKYEFLRAGLYRIGNTAGTNEMPYMALIQAVCEKLQKQLYHSPVLRFFHQVKGELYDRPRVVHAHQKLLNENLTALKQALKSRGLDAIAQKLDLHRDYEIDPFTLRIEGQLDSERKVNINVHFEKDGIGQYQLGDIHLALLKDGTSADDVSITIEKEHQLNRVQMVNLLQGRPVYLFKGQGVELGTGAWLQLKKIDFFNDYKLLVYERDYGYNLKEALHNLAVDTMLLRLDAPDVMLNLRLGNSFQLTGHHPKDEPFLFQADPGNRSIKIMDTSGNEMTRENLVSSLKHEADHSNHLEVNLNPVKENEKRISPEQGQSL